MLLHAHDSKCGHWGPESLRDPGAALEVRQRHSTVRRPLLLTWIGGPGQFTFRWMVKEAARPASCPTPTRTVTNRPSKSEMTAHVAQPSIRGTGGEGRRDKPMGMLSTVTDAPHRRIVPARAGR